MRAGLPLALQAELESALGAVLGNVTVLGGGSINSAARIETATGSYFLKWNEQAGLFSAEARGLEVLRAAQALKVPAVIAVGEPKPGQPGFLLLEWLGSQTPHDAARLAESFGQGLAALHRSTSTQHGLDHDNFIGSLSQHNYPNANWPSFYADRRIMVQASIAGREGRLSPGRARMIGHLCARMADFLPDAAPALLHGDLWSGNYLAIAGDEAALIDPAVYYGHREVDLAMTRLFGGFPPRFYAAYAAAFPLEPGHEARIALYQLYPLMVHMNLFGGGYTAQVDSILRHFVGQSAAR